MEKLTDSSDQLLAEFNALTMAFDPWYQYTDDHTVYMKHALMLNRMINIRQELGLFGQHLKIPICNPMTGTLQGD